MLNTFKWRIVFKLNNANTPRLVVYRPTWGAALKTYSGYAKRTDFHSGVIERRNGKEWVATK